MANRVLRAMRRNNDPELREGLFIHVTGRCRQQFPSCIPCQKRKAQQSQQILFEGL